MVEAAPCPICAAPGRRIGVELAFAPRPGLPTDIALMACAPCDFVFVHPRGGGEADYYKVVRNDVLNAPEIYRNAFQLELISQLIRSSDARTVLDFGCGGGGLVCALAARFPERRFTGLDVNAGFPRPGPNVAFTTALGDDAYDLILMSHVVEHLSDLSVLEQVLARLAPGGAAYIEVPDPARYGAVHQPHYLYYVDRLHLNHFSETALRRLLPPDMAVEAAGTYDMPYDEGPLYPARYMVARRTAPAPLAERMTAYARAQEEAHAAVRRSLQGRRFYVYGYGDNFSRARSPGGPLGGLEDGIIAVIDRGAAGLNQAAGDRFTLLAPDAPLAPDGAPIVCAVTRNGVDAGFFAAAYPGREVIWL